MNPVLKNLIIIGTFLLIACVGIFLSFSAPYVANNDELVYLTGMLQAQEQNLPDAYMLQGMEFGSYLYPKVMSRWYEELGFDLFKSFYLIFLIVGIGLAAYIAFRLLLLPWVPSLLLAVVALIPRFSSGMEIFGVLTFKEAIGRASATPLFFLGTALFLYRLRKKKSLWPVFAFCGIFIFLHPVTVMLFAFVSLIAMSVTYFYVRTPIVKIVQEVFLCGGVFVAAGSYFFVEVLTRLARGVALEGATTAQYVEAIIFRNAWEFPSGSLQWFPHMGIVSFFFIAVIVLFYALPALHSVRTKYLSQGGGEILVWGLTVAISSLVLTVGLPGLNLYFMTHADAPYIFQQWSRISKFYYLGIFTALVPVLYALWQWYLESKLRIKNIILVLFVLSGIASSSFMFEVTQFIIGYPNFTESYIPQSLSNVPDDTTIDEYRETCAALESLGATSEVVVLSNNFALRYYCKADLYVTYEEGSAYQQLHRSDVIDWYERIQEQRQAFKDGDPETIVTFAKTIDATFIVVPRTPKYVALETFENLDVVLTAKSIVLKILK